MDSENIIKTIEEKGYYVISNYWSNEKCNILTEHIKKVFPRGFIKTNTEIGGGGDYRMGQSENSFILCKEFLNDPFLSEIGNNYIGHVYNRKRCQIGVVNASNSKNSGGGWHVDNHDKQFKAILYLTDVDENSGNFSIVENSRGTIKTLGTYRNYKDDMSESRIEESKVFDHFGNERIKNIVGNKGTLILVDTSNIHRGRDINTGSRYSLTNYYYH